MDHPLLTHLKADATRDLPARGAALHAVDQMLTGASRSAQLLAEAQRVALDAAMKPTVRAQRASALANEAYAHRTNAEVAKYRAMYSMIAEQAGNEAHGWRSIAAQAKTKTQHTVAIEKARYHGKQRDLMLTAAEATTRALQHVPPLPLVGPQRVSDTRETTSLPSHGWRPKLYSELVGNFFPADVRRAAGGLNGLAQLPLGDTTWWGALKNAFGVGIQATGRAAAAQGQRVSGSDPAGGVALNVGGNLLDALSVMLGTNAQAGAAGAAPVAPPKSSIPWGLVATGAVGVGALVVVVRHFSR